jgi:hypothetical protein
MLQKKVNYIDFNGEAQEEVLYFNLTEPEIVRLDVEFEGGLETYTANLDTERPENILSLFERIIKVAFGKKSEDGKYFRKSEEETAKFYDSAAYSALFVSLVQDADTAAAFFNGVLTQTAPPTKE